MVQDFGLDIGNELCQVKSRQLPAPGLVYKDGRPKAEPSGSVRVPFSITVPNHLHRMCMVFISHFHILVAALSSKFSVSNYLHQQLAQYSIRGDVDVPDYICTVFASVFHRSWNLRDRAMKTSNVVQRWGVINFDPNVDRNLGNYFREFAK